uniref:T-box domain-containing protein n=1 Tax=Macrostomum lignano TaxID=282301 RepID=A0A1I8I3R5_9PLAT
VGISLSNSSTWRKFSRQNTEMIVTKVGRRMFPTLSLDIQGLDPAKKYEVYVTLMLADRHTLKYQRGVWLPNGQGEVYPPPGCTVGLAYVHPDSPAPGKHWTRQEVAFMRLKLTNKLDCFASEPARNGTMIFAYSMHKYLPVVHIRELAKNDAAAFYTAVTFPGTEFITVTAYQNPELTDLKIQFNPYAKGIRNQGDRSGPLLIDSFRPPCRLCTSSSSSSSSSNSSFIQQCSKVFSRFVGTTCSRITGADAQSGAVMGCRRY